MPICIIPQRVCFVLGCPQDQARTRNCTSCHSRRTPVTRSGLRMSQDVLSIEISSGWRILIFIRKQSLLNKKACHSLFIRLVCWVADEPSFTETSGKGIWLHEVLLDLLWEWHQLDWNIDLCITFNVNHTSSPHASIAPKNLLILGNQVLPSKQKPTLVSLWHLDNGVQNSVGSKCCFAESSKGSKNEPRQLADQAWILPKGQNTLHFPRAWGTSTRLNSWPAEGLERIKMDGFVRVCDGLSWFVCKGHLQSWMSIDTIFFPTRTATYRAGTERSLRRSLTRFYWEDMGTWGGLSLLSFWMWVKIPKSWYLCEHRISW